MPYRLFEEEPLGRGLRRIAAEQVAAAAVGLESCRPSPQEAVHDARKRLKKTRAVLRLVREEVGQPFYGRENARLRDIGRDLAPYRDAEVRHGGFRALVDRHRDLLPHDAFQDIEAILRARGRERAEGFPGSEERRAALAALRAEAARPEAWPVEIRAFESIAPGLHRTYRLGARRMNLAYQEPSPERFHDWRKSVKFLWYQIRILQLAWPEKLKPAIGALHELSDLLGEAHDLSELARAVRGHEPPSYDRAAGELLSGLVAARCAALHALARPFGERLYAEDPQAFVERMASYWRAWRRESPGVPSPA